MSVVSFYNLSQFFPFFHSKHQQTNVLNYQLEYMDRLVSCTDSPHSHVECQSMYYELIEYAIIIIIIIIKLQLFPSRIWKEVFNY